MNRQSCQRITGMAMDDAAVGGQLHADAEALERVGGEQLAVGERRRRRRWHVLGRARGGSRRSGRRGRTRSTMPTTTAMHDLDDAVAELREVLDQRHAARRRPRPGRRRCSSGLGTARGAFGTAGGPLLGGGAAFLAAVLAASFGGALTAGASRRPPSARRCGVRRFGRAGSGAPPPRSRPRRASRRPSATGAPPWRGRCGGRRPGWGRRPCRGRCFISFWKPVDRRRRSPIVLPIWRAASGRRCGPSTIRAMSRMTRSSPPPMLNMDPSVPVGPRGLRRGRRARSGGPGVGGRRAHLGHGHLDLAEALELHAAGRRPPRRSHGAAPGRAASPAATATGGTAQSSDIRTRLRQRRTSRPLEEAVEVDQVVVA